jgi:hypothetical protein
MQTKEVLELIEFLREHLTVNISLNKEYEEDYSYVTCRVSLEIDGEEITSSSDSVYLPK